MGESEAASSRYRGFRSPRPVRDFFLRLRSSLASPFLHLRAAQLTLLRSRWRFSFEGARHRYFYHRYNRTWRNERAVEVPLVRERLRAAGPARLLEVGNVLGHYLPRGHDVLDKYDDAPGVIREDAAEFRPSAAYDLIVSVSTLEHIGWDEVPRDPGKVLRAVENLRRCLAPGGTLLATWPVGYNPELDRRVDEGSLGAARLGWLRRTSWSNVWVEATWDEVRSAKFAEPFPFANAVCVGSFTRLDA